MTIAPVQPELVEARRSRFLGSLYAGNARSVMSRGLLATRSTNYLVVLSGFFEPIFYLLSMGLGLGALVGTVATTTGVEVSYPAFIADTARSAGAIYAA